MPKSLPPIDDDVFEALQALAEPLVDDVNSVLRRLLRLPLSEGVGSEAATDDGGVVGDAAATRSRAPKPKGRGKATARASSKSRAPRGSLLPEAEYELPMLRYLAEQGGRAPASEVVEAVGIALKERFKPTDLEPLDSGDIRWKSRVQFVRLKLIREGTMTKDSPRGVWAITELGREKVQEAEQ